ncbi:unnamed protein product [Trypanosoma congolense IL3000]|uniref:WGS project CAEQ00000000 data, annotated contig 350 n=1 Tax=Trypanosoma congolense (strain IL3000) TaxID=1068625 RepID=F9WF52_TRYCI|nr:unnamed protein product [Trypanosoma congolense IL3000]
MAGHNKADDTRMYTSWIICIISVLSHTTFLPTIHSFFRRRYAFESAMALFGFAASLLYHICQDLNIEIFMDEGAWHRMDNIFVLSFVGAWSVYMCTFRDPFVERITKYSLLMVCMIFQARGPWQPINTIAPVILSLSLPICVYAYRWQVPAFFGKRLAAFAVTMVIAVWFFIKGLDDKRDPFKIYHSMWHFLCGIASYMMWTMVRVPGATGLLGKEGV